MDALRDHVISKLREARKALLDIPKSQLTGQTIQQGWFNVHHRAIRQSDGMSGVLIESNLNRFMRGFWDETDNDVCLVLRSKIVELLDQSITAIDSGQVVQPILDELILRVSDTKLSTLLKEFNGIRTSQPNSAAMCFRTILSLIIKERAKIVDPVHRLATKTDTSFERDLNDTINHPTLFNDAEKKLLKRYFNSGSKDSFDNVVHKSNYLIEKGELDGSIDLLNHLLPTILP